jgi:transcriptional antiterminator NusG
MGASPVVIRRNRQVFGQAVASSTAYPPERFLEPHWYACHTRARAEKQVDRLLARSGFETYLPLVEQVRQWADRKKRVAFPLFPGYTFARFRLADTLMVVQTAGLVSVLSGSGRGYPTPVRDEELYAVRILVEGIEATGADVETNDGLEEGVPVLVVSGPFRGIQGILIEVNGRTRVSVQLSPISLGASVEMDRGSLQTLV